jgi:hypothetical protein
MKKWLAILFSVVYLSSTTCFSEILKLPVLVEHYFQYDEGFVHFFVHHYGGHEEDEDWDTDQKLPFINLSSILIVSFIIPENTFSFKKKEFYPPLKQKLVSDDDEYTHDFLTKVFQPPQFC